MTAKEVIKLFDDAIDKAKSGELNIRRYESDYMEYMGVNDATAPIVLMFNSFVMGLDISKY